MLTKLEVLRYKFQEKMKDGVPEPPGEFDTRDLDRLKDDRYLTRVMEHCDGNVEAALKMLWSTMVWRQRDQVNEIDRTVNVEYLKLGIIYPRGRDANGNLLLIMNWKLYTRERSTAELKKVVVYWLERLEREECGRPLTLFFDLDGCGMSNVDPELIMYMVTLLKSHYPKFVNRIIIYQMPWILTAGYSIVRGLLPAKAVDRLRVVGRGRLGDYVQREQAAVRWGGGDNYVFEFLPEKTGNGSKRVTFAEVADGRVGCGIVKIHPVDHLTFTRGINYKSDMLITNRHEGYLAFKIRTTGPEKFKVRPTFGILGCDATQKVSINVLPGFDPSVAVNEKFLVVAAPVTEDEIARGLVHDTLNHPNGKCEFKLKCKLIDSADNKSDISMDHLDVYRLKHSELCGSVYILELLQVATLGFAVLMVIFGYLIYWRYVKVQCVR